MAEPSSSGPQSKAVSEPAARRDLLLVSDDDNLCSELGFVAPEGFDVRCARDAREAFSAIGERVPDVCVVEIRSGSAGGFALARDMSFRAGSKDVPVVMLLERMQDRWLAEQAGAAIALEQPIDPGVLAMHVESLFATSRGAPDSQAS